MIPFESFLNEAHKSESFFIDTRRFLHRNPELSWQENRTSAYLQALLKKFDIDVAGTYAKTGFSVELGNGFDENVIAWRADMDALPIQDQKKNVPYSSAFPGVAHLCGHDLHSTIALGIAMLLRKFEPSKKVRIFWQPAEETSPSGAPKMIEDGVLKNVSKIFALHADPTVKSGQIAINPGYETASYDAVRVSVQSQSTVHSARPHLGADLLWITSKLLQDWYSLAGRITDARHPSVLTFCQINGGSAINVIPEKIEFAGTLRCVSNENRTLIKKHLLQSAAFMSSLHQIEIKVDFSSDCPAVLNDAVLSQKAKDILSPITSVITTEHSMGAEDFAWFTQVCPAVFIRLGTAKDESTSWPLHHALFDVDESVIASSIAFLAYFLYTIN